MKKKLFLLVMCCLYAFVGISQQQNPVNNRILIVLDVQGYYTSKIKQGDDNQKFIDSINFVINKNLPNNVIYVQSVHRLLNLSFSAPFIYASVDSMAMRLDQRMIVVNNQIFIKDDASAFTIKELNVFLKQNNIKEIVIIGLLAEKCVYASLMAGKKLGYDMYVIPEAVVGKSLKSKSRIIKKMKRWGVGLIGVSELL